MNRKEEIKKEIAELRESIFLEQMSEDSFEPYTQSSQYIHNCYESIKILEKELEELERNE